jgi:heavy metal translocating P-type ATPase
MKQYYKNLIPFFDLRTITDGALIVFLLAAIVLNYFNFFAVPIKMEVLMVLSLLGFIPVLVSVYFAILKKQITVDLLAAIALFFTFIKGEWFSAAFINLMLASARLFDRYVQTRTKNIISQLLKLRPTKVKIKIGDTIDEISIDRVKIGDLAVVEPGSRIPIDGTVVSGQASVDESTLTGESERVVKRVGDKVFSSTFDEFGSLLVQVEKIGEDTTFAKIVALVEEAGRSKTKTEKIADRFSTWYIILTFVAIIVIYLISHNTSLVLSILLITCADDIAVAIPLGFTIVISKAAKHGIIIKGADIIERLAKVDVFLTDKTGTLTRGDSRITDIVTFGIDQNKFLEIAGICAINSNHPTSITIIEYLKQQNIDIIAPDDFEETPGDGIAIKKGENNYFAGKLSFLEKNGVKISEENRALVEKKKAGGESTVVIGANGKVIGLIGFEDEIRPNAKALITHTKELGVKRWVMITGDNENVARRVAGQLGIDEYVANLKPEDKLKEIKKFRHKDSRLAMIGDGVNDAAALALADVSIAMGVKGADAAIEAADIALMRDDLSRIPEAIKLSRESIFIVKENFIIWGISNVIGLALVFSGVLGPVGASAYNFLTDFLPIGNVFRIFNKKLAELPKNF